MSEQMSLQEVLASALTEIDELSDNPEIEEPEILEPEVEDEPDTIDDTVEETVDEVEVDETVYEGLEPEIIEPIQDRVEDASITSFDEIESESTDSEERPNNDWLTNIVEERMANVVNNSVLASYCSSFHERQTVTKTNSIQVVDTRLGALSTYNIGVTFEASQYDEDEDEETPVIDIAEMEVVQNTLFAMNGPVYHANGHSHLLCVPDSIVSHIMNRLVQSGYSTLMADAIQQSYTATQSVIFTLESDEGVAEIRFNVVTMFGRQPHMSVTVIQTSSDGSTITFEGDFKNSAKVNKSNFNTVEVFEPGVLQVDTLLSWFSNVEQSFEEIHAKIGRMKTNVHQGSRLFSNYLITLAYPSSGAKISASYGR